MTPATRVGVFGSSATATLLALAMRDYGNHSVVGLGLNLRAVDDIEALASWGHLPIPDCGTLDRLVEYGSDVVFYCESRFPSEFYAAVARSDRRPVLVIASPIHPNWAEAIARGAPAGIGVVQMGDLTTNRLDRLLTPPSLHARVLRGDQDVARTVERLWRPIVNTIPFTWQVVTTPSGTGLPWPSSAFWVGPGMSPPST